MRSRRVNRILKEVGKTFYGSGGLFMQACHHVKRGN